MLESPGDVLHEPSWGLEFRRLTPAVVREDHAAVMRDIAMLRRWSGQDWPTPTFTVEANLVDLERHDREHRSGVALTYSVVLRGTIVGCVYVHPLIAALGTRDVRLPGDLPVHDVAVRGWSHDVTPDDLIDASMAAFGPKVDEHHRTWWQTNTEMVEQLDACDRLGLSTTMEFPGPTRTWVLRTFA